MKEACICAVITNNDPAAIRDAEPLVDLYEVRIDLIGSQWAEAAKQLKKPWIACNRRAEEGGSWQGPEARRIEQLLVAIELGATIVDVELCAKNVENIVPCIRRRAKCLLSYHDFQKTPPLDDLKRIVQKQLKTGADICKVVTTAQSMPDNLTVLQLVREFPENKLVAFAMGQAGLLSRVLSPLTGGEFTYASTGRGKESAPGQMTAAEMRKIYELLK